jgi:hypothetical protein
MLTDEWTIEVTYSLGAQLEDRQIDMLSDRLEDLDWTVAQLPDGYLSILGGSEDDEEPLDATSRVVDIAKRTLDDLDIHGNLERVVISSQGWREKEAVEPSLPELLATKDISKVLGVSRQRVSQLQREHPNFRHPSCRQVQGRCGLVVQSTGLHRSGIVAPVVEQPPRARRKMHRSCQW